MMKVGDNEVAIFMWPFALTTEEIVAWLQVSRRMRNHLAQKQEEDKQIREYFAVSMGMTQTEADMYIDAHLNDVDLYPDPEKGPNGG
ncbi:hypothetical protein LCGC14_1710800 [marine sediment metagenome]|uniref:Uncharacterized protein n=1 Tax=marine sediment metagenome TaxID=412755 RepID=A0A0F9JVP5_9ZZZZ